MNKAKSFGAATLVSALMAVGGCALNDDIASKTMIPKLNLDAYNSIGWQDTGLIRVVYLPYGSFVNFQPYYSFCDKSEFEKIIGFETHAERIGYLKHKTPFGIWDLVHNEFLLVGNPESTGYHGIKEVIDLKGTDFVHGKYAPKCPKQ